MYITDNGNGSSDSLSYIALYARVMRSYQRSLSKKGSSDITANDIVQSSLTKSSVKEVYYEWNDSISQYSILVSCLDYNQKCSAILKVIKGLHSHKILHDGYPGGLGHKFLSIFYSLTYALLLNRRFYRRIDSMN